MCNNNHLYRKIEAIQNKATARRASRLSDSRNQLYEQYSKPSIIKEEFTIEQIETTKKEIQETAMKSQKRAKQLWLP